MNAETLTSIIINNYNYERFLSEAIDSALNQTYPHVEVIVVDDGSTDNSRDIINRYGNCIIPALKENGGQASALNVGVEASKGEIIFFLDADDIFLANKVEKIVNLFTKISHEAPDAIISNYIQTIDEKGASIDINILKTLFDTSDWRYLPEINRKKNSLIEEVITKLSTSEQVYKFAAKYRFIPYLGMPTSGLAMTRSLANKIFPIPSKVIKTSADDFVVKAASLIGTVYLTNNFLTKYRIHGKNSWYGCQEKISEIHVNTLDRFLNSKLKDMGRKEVFSYFNSIPAKGYYQSNYGHECSLELINLAVNVIKWHINAKTIVFFIKTVTLAFVFSLKSSILRQKFIQ